MIINVNINKLKDRVIDFLMKNKRIRVIMPLSTIYQKI